MAIGYFTRLCAIFRCSLNKALLIWLYRPLPILFNHILASFLCGRHIFVSSFPSYVPGFSQTAGWYFVTSIIIDHTGSLELGLVLGDDVDYYHFSDIQISIIKN
jgi:hypothetical protein